MRRAQQLVKADGGFADDGRALGGVGGHFGALHDDICV